MMIPRLLACMWCLVLTAAAGPADEGIASGVAKFEGAYREWDGDKFAEAVGAFQQAVEKEPGSVRAHYWLAVARFHQMLQSSQPAAGVARPAEALAARDAAVAACEAALERDGGHAESHALLATLLGMKIRDGGWREALRHGRELQRHWKQAMESGGENPRVRYLMGVSRFHTAKDEAGRREALATLDDAENLFRKEASAQGEPTAPRWGRSSCLSFIGRCHEQLGERAEALAAYRRALAMHPKDSQARAGLARLSSS